MGFGPQKSLCELQNAPWRWDAHFTAQPLSPSDIKHCQRLISPESQSDSWHLISLGLLRSKENFPTSCKVAEQKLPVWHLHMLWSSASIFKIFFSDSKRLFLNKTWNIEVFPEYVFLNIPGILGSHSSLFLISQFANFHNYNLTGFGFRLSSSTRVALITICILTPGCCQDFVWFGTVT